MKRLLLSILLLVTSPSLLAEMETFTLDTQHQLASELVPTLRDLVAPGGTVTSFNNVLIIKTTADNYNQLRSVIDQLDTPIRQLLISVTQDERTARSRRAVRVDGSISAGDTEISVGDGDKDQISIDYGTRSRQGKGTQTVRAMEGQPAFVQIGEQVPVTSSNGWTTSTTYQSVVRGFYVTVRVREGFADVSINARNDRLQNNGKQALNGNRSIDTQSASTRVQVKLGDWVTIGGLDESGRSNNQQINSRSSGTLNRSGGFYLKVDEL
ncbi:secretin N-terminal domain-containing protein [Aestuariirhabdus sp. LZHN29]|uniref:secretin N-terminal domain-containing protein n=1 Tax=Aestuariirhabdus sp. LZHN29 TaxID=3417462 RepID=UPI003CEAF8B2